MRNVTLGAEPTGPGNSVQRNAVAIGVVGFADFRRPFANIVGPVMATHALIDLQVDLILADLVGDQRGLLTVGSIETMPGIEFF